MRNKVPILLTVAILIIGSLSLTALFYLPGADAPQIRLTLRDADGVKSVSYGETAEYVIRIENTGKSNGRISLDQQGSARGWRSTLSHERVHLRSNEFKTVSLYVTPESRDAEPRMDVNVIATRGTNVTIVGTSTYYKGSISIRKEGSEIWQTYFPGAPVNQGDDLKTDYQAYAQFNFGDDVSVAMMPDSQIHCRFSNVNGPVKTFWFNLDLGTAAFYVDLPSISSSFTLKLDNGGMATINTAEPTVFTATSNGQISVFQGSVNYEEGGIRGIRGTRAGTDITQGMDSSGATFKLGVIHYTEDTMIGSLEDSNGAVMGFENNGDFFSDGQFDGMVFRRDDGDHFYFKYEDNTPMTLQLYRITAGIIDLTCAFIGSEPITFTFSTVETVANSIELVLSEDSCYISPSSDTTYDLEIENDQGGVFILEVMTVEANKGNEYRILNIDELSSETTDSVFFGFDDNGDGNADESVEIHSGMYGHQVMAYVEDDDDDDDEDNMFWIVVIIILLLVLIYVLYLIFTPKKQARSAEDREAAYRLMKKERLAGVEEPGEEGESWDDQDMPLEPMEPSTMGVTPSPGAPPTLMGEDLLEEVPPGPAPEIPGMADEDEVLFQESGEQELPPELPGPESLLPDDYEPPEVPPKVTEFKEEVEKEEYKEIERFLLEKPEIEEFTPPAELKRKMEKELEDNEEWWDDWTEELDEILRQ